MELKKKFTPCSGHARNSQCSKTININVPDEFRIDKKLRNATSNSYMENAQKDKERSTVMSSRRKYHQDLTKQVTGSIL